MQDDVLSSHQIFHICIALSVDKIPYLFKEVLLRPTPKRRRFRLSYAFHFESEPQRSTSASRDFISELASETTSFCSHASTFHDAKFFLNQHNARSFSLTK